MRQAILDANASMDASSTITVQAGLSGLVQLQSALDPLNKNITINGAGGASLGVVRAMGATTDFPIFTVNEGTTCEIDWLYDIGAGTEGGINNQGNLTLNYCSVLNNSGGSGIHNGSGTLDLYNCEVEYNQTESDGGGISTSSGSVYCSGTTIAYNGARNGGGIFTNSQGNTIDLESCSVSNNTATAQGGGIYNTCTLIMNDGTLGYNQAGTDGGGLYQNAVSASLSGVEIAGNQAKGATGKGGGFCLNAGSGTFSQCDFSNNTANTGTAGAIAAGVTLSDPGCTFGAMQRIQAY